MADRPMLFSAPMVRALLDGSKTQTRRIINPQPPIRPEINECSGHLEVYNGDELAGRLKMKAITGDRLWVRETWKPHSIYADLKPSQIPPSNIFYRADDAYAPSNTKWWPSLFMLRWASRLTLVVTDVRVERLQDISEADAIAEGAMRIGEEHIKRGSTSFDKGPNFWKFEIDDFSLCAPTAKEAYALLWDWINGEGAWDANPWIVAYSFAVHRGNIDQIARAA